MLNSYKDLKICQKAYAVCLEIYRLTAKFPSEEKYGLTSQIIRSAIFLPSNIPEEYCRKITLNYIRMLYISYGSLCELETQIMLSGDLRFIETDELVHIVWQALESLNPRILESSFPAKLEKNQKRMP